MQRVGGQFWKSELDVKLTKDCLIKADFVEQKAKFVSRLNSVMFIYRQKKKSTGNLPIPVLSQAFVFWDGAAVWTGVYHNDTFAVF